MVFPPDVLTMMLMFPWESRSRVLVVTRQSQGYTYSASAVGNPLFIDIERLSRVRMALAVAAPARHEVHVNAAHPDAGRHVRLDLCATRTWASGQATSSFLFITMTRLEAPVLNAVHYRTEVAVRHACGLSFYGVIVRGESASGLWRRVDSVTPRMCAAPSVGPIIGSTDYDGVTVIGPGYTVVPGASDVTPTVGTVIIRPRSYWPVSLSNLIYSVMTMDVKVDMQSWLENAAGAEARIAASGSASAGSASAGSSVGAVGVTTAALPDLMPIVLPQLEDTDDNDVNDDDDDEDNDNDYDVGFGMGSEEESGSGANMEEDSGENM